MRLTESPSPNFNDRRAPVSLLVLHYTGMESAEAAITRLCDRQAAVSAHYVVCEDGRIVRLVAEDKRAWHAGAGAWGGVSDVNSASVGIEIVNGGHCYGLPPYPGAQIEALIALCRDILDRWPITPGGVIGHSDLAPERKLDPGEHFPWRTLAEAGVGVWPEPDAKTPGQDAPVDDAAVRRAHGMLAAIGYALDGPDSMRTRACAAAFQRRFRPARIDGVIDAQTLERIEAVHAALTGDRPT